MWAPTSTTPEWRSNASYVTEDTKYVAGFDEVLSAQGARTIKTPYRTPNANAFAERFVRTIRNERLDHLLVVNRAHLAWVLREYVRHCNGHRPHQGISVEIPASVPMAPAPTRANADGNSKQHRDRIRRHDRLSGLIHEYELVA
jgi:putative transposase